MRTISDHVENWLDGEPVIRRFLAAGIINHSALARTVKDQIETENGEAVSLEAITIALNRSGKSLRTDRPSVLNPLDFVGDVSIQSGLSILIYETADFDTLEIPAETRKHNAYFVSTKGIWHASIITTSEIAASKKLRETARQHTGGLTATTIRLKPGHFPVPGVCAGILSALANKGVSLAEVISTHNELTVLTDRANSDLALKTLLRARKS